MTDKDVETLRHISPVANIEKATLYGAFSTFARQYQEIQQVSADGFPQG